MAALDTTQRFGDPDAAFVALVAAHRDLSPEESRRLDAALVLLLANHIGDSEVLAEAIAAARAAIRAEAGSPDAEGTVP